MFFDDVDIEKNGSCPYFILKRMEKINAIIN